MSGPIENLEDFVDGKVEFKPLTESDRAKITASLAEVATVSTTTVDTVEMPEFYHRREAAGLQEGS